MYFQIFDNWLKRTPTLMGFPWSPRTAMAHKPRVKTAVSTHWTSCRVTWTMTFSVENVELGPAPPCWNALISPQNMVRAMGIPNPSNQ